jgi:hypothetical protein
MLCLGQAVFVTQGFEPKLGHTQPVTGRIAPITSCIPAGLMLQEVGILPVR